MLAQEQQRLKNEGNPYNLSLSSCQKGENKELKNKEILEYFKRKAGFPLDMLDPAYDNVVPTFIPQTSTKENSDDQIQVSLGSDAWDNSPSNG